MPRTGLESEHAATRFLALDALSALGTIARPLQSKFRKASSDPEAIVRLAALLALESSGAEPERLATILRRRCVDESGEATTATGPSKPVWLAVAIDSA